MSALSGFSSVKTDGTGAVEAANSKKLISDLVWLEQKIARANVKKDAKKPRGAQSLSPARDRGAFDPAKSMSEPGKRSKVSSPTSGGVGETPKLQLSDSLSFASGDDNAASSVSLNSSPLEGAKVRQPGDDDGSPESIALGYEQQGYDSVVCRDCFAPPGKLKIVITSTKDGPAVHTVKKGSALTDSIHPGDLIISVDNVDTRASTAEEVMKMMTTRSRFVRKITVLHFVKAGEIITSNSEASV